MVWGLPDRLLKPLTLGETTQRGGIREEGLQQLGETGKTAWELGQYHEGGGTHSEYPQVG